LSLAALRERAKLLEQQAAQLRKLALALHEKTVREELVKELGKPEAEIDLVRSALLLARLDNDEVDVAGRPGGGGRPWGPGGEGGGEGSRRAGAAVSAGPLLLHRARLPRQPDGLLQPLEQLPVGGDRRPRGPADHAVGAVPGAGAAGRAEDGGRRPAGALRG